MKITVGKIGTDKIKRISVMIKLVLLIILLLISLLAVFRAPAYYLWLLAIGVAEFPLVFAAITGVLLIAGIWIEKYQLASTIIGLVALLLFLSPIVRAYLISTSVKNNFIAAFGAGSANINGDSTQAPFSFAKLFKGTSAITPKAFVYNTDESHPLSLDFYPSAMGGKRPCVIVVHGGSWSSGDNRQLPELNSFLAAEGFNVAAINYRLAPKFQNPVPVQDLHQAINYIKQHAGELQVDTNKLVLLGRSAGAQIAMLYAYTQHDAGIKGVIDFYGPADMVWGYSVPASPLIMDSRKVMRNYLGGAYDAVPDNYKASSPIEYVNRNSVPTLIIHGDNDVLVSPGHSRRLNDSLAKNHVPHFYLRLPWATHGFDFNMNGPGGQISTYAVHRFINNVTKK